MIYKKELAPKILDGTKTETRRLKKPRFKRDSIQPCQTSYFSKAFAHVLIKGIWQQHLARMTIEDARAEGFDSISAFCLYFKKVNRISDSDWERIYKYQPVWAIQFELVKENDG